MEDMVLAERPVAIGTHLQDFIVIGTRAIAASGEKRGPDALREQIGRRLSKCPECNTAEADEACSICNFGE